MTKRKTVWMTTVAATLLLAAGGAAVAQSGWGMGQGHGMGHGKGQGYGMQMMQTIDENGDGVISDDEAAARVESVFAAKDSDSNDELTMEEFAATRMGPGPGNNQERMMERQKARFTESDGDNNGLVTKAEFLAAGKARFVAADTDKDGRVTPWEFRSQHQH